MKQNGPQITKWNAEWFESVCPEWINEKAARNSDLVNYNGVLMSPEEAHDLAKEIIACYEDMTLEESMEY